MRLFGEDRRNPVAPAQITNGIQPLRSQELYIGGGHRARSIAEPRYA
jgi:hypothetical protein